MSSWLHHTVDCVVLNVGLAAGFWAWTACSTVLAARWESRRGCEYLTVRLRIVSLSVASAIPLVGAASVLLLTHPKAEVLGIRQLTIAAPYHLWVWAAWLIAEPLVTAGFVSSQPGGSRSPSDSFRGFLPSRGRC